MLIGKNLIAGEPVDATDASYTARGALAQFEEASSADVDRALEAAAHAFDSYRALPPDARAAFLDRIAAEIDTSDELIDAAHVETGLPRQRLAGERGRTAGQLRMFGAWCGRARGSTRGSIARSRSVRRCQSPTSAAC
jgi:alpha-ketoglutaric semialdehyde dehydrogenase